MDVVTLENISCREVHQWVLNLVLRFSLILSDGHLPGNQLRAVPGQQNACWLLPRQECDWKSPGWPATGAGTNGERGQIH